MQSLKQVLNVYLHKTGLAKGIAHQTALQRWPKIVGEAIAKNTRAESVEHGIIKVITKNPTWRQELLFKKEEIIQKLNTELGKGTIKDIQFL